MGSPAKRFLPGLVEEAQVDVHARARPVVVRLGHEGRIETVRARRGLDGALQQQPVERCADRVGAVLQVDLELAGTALLHDSVDGQALRLADAIDVVDEGLQRVQLLEAERQRAVGIVAKARPGPRARRLRSAPRLVT